MTVEYRILGSFDVHKRTSLGFWQVSVYDLPLVQQLLDCHQFLEDCELLGLCIYNGTELHIFCEDLINFMNDNNLSPDDLNYHEKPILGIDSEDFEQVIGDEIDYNVPSYCDELVSNPELSFGRNPGGGCLGFWKIEDC